MKKSTKAEIISYSKGSMNAKTAKAYAFTLLDGTLYSGMYMYSGEELKCEYFDGYCAIGSKNPVLLKGEDVTV